MTEKEYRNLISTNEIAIINKDQINELYQVLVTSIEKETNDIFTIEAIKRLDDLSLGIAIKNTDVIDIAFVVNVKKELYEGLLSSVIYNFIENSIILNIKVVKSIERDYLNKLLIVKLNSQQKIIIRICNHDQFAKLELRTKWLDELNEKYTYFKNSIKMIKCLLKEQNIEIINNYLLIVLFACGLEKYHMQNKYDDYITAFGKIIDDFISQKKIEIDNEYNVVKPSLSCNFKGYTVVDPFNTEVNLAANINDANISEFRKLKKRLNKFREVTLTDQGSATLTLDVTPVTTAENYQWHYELVGRNLSSQGGEYQLNEIEYKTAVLKGLFRGLKVIMNSGINNKNILVISPVEGLLKCEERALEEQENNSRRKTITKYIEENKLLIKWKIVK